MSPVFSLDEELIFPHPVLREDDGLLAVGGSLTSERLLLAYRWGIFPWYHEGQPILWWWTSPRLMVQPAQIRISHSMRNIINRNSYTVTMDQSFEAVMKNCGTVSRKGQRGTWILPEIIDAYKELHKEGFAHSVEVWSENELVGGLYGIGLGKLFFGESMFAKKPNASKLAFIHLGSHLASLGFEWIDCQQDTPHMRSLGAELIDEDAFLQILRTNQLYMLKHGDSNFSGK